MACRTWDTGEITVVHIRGGYVLQDGCGETGKFLILRKELGVCEVRPLALRLPGNHNLLAVCHTQK